MLYITPIRYAIVPFSWGWGAVIIKHEIVLIRLACHKSWFFFLNVFFLLQGFCSLLSHYVLRSWVFLLYPHLIQEKEKNVLLNPRTSEEGSP